MNQKLSFALVGIIALTAPLLINVVHGEPTDITVDGDPSDWTVQGLSPVETDPPFNEPHSYNPISSDLLETWACKNDSVLFLMMKVRGGMPDYDAANYFVTMNIDPQGSTGDQLGDDYFVSQTQFGGWLFTWNTTTLTWNLLNSSKVKGAAGGLGYIEFGVPLNEIGGNVSNLKLAFVTYDSTYKEIVNRIVVTLSPPVTVPEFPSVLVIMLSLVAMVASVALFKKHSAC